jgi:hypothetical protein
MTPYLVFLSLLLIVAITFGALRLFKGPLRFDSVFIPLATVFFFLPFACLSLLIWIAISMGLVLVSARMMQVLHRSRRKGLQGPTTPTAQINEIERASGLFR